MAFSFKNEGDERRAGKPCFSTRCVFQSLVFVLSVVFSVRNFSSVSQYMPVEEWNDFFPGANWSIVDSFLSSNFEYAGYVTRPSKIKIAYAVTITGCPADRRTILLDGAAVLHQSIRLASVKSKYDYQMMAFVHPEAQSCGVLLSKLGYEIQIKHTPFSETDIQNENLVKVQKNSCCGIKEYLKLYSFLQFDYPVVIHLDLDCMVLRPLDDIIDLMLDPALDRSSIPAMWLKPQDFPERVDFLFTRDYGMVEPGKRNPHQIGVQGGFLVVRPNRTDFDRCIEIIKAGGDFAIGAGWGGKQKAYGGYYGAGTIQGLASYYYGEYAQNRSVELNRCFYDNMVDDPYGQRSNRCRTLEPQCQDCRETDIEDIYLSHFTNCGKPDWCINPASWWNPKEGHEKQHRLCMELFREWHLLRLSLEREWMNRYSDYEPLYAREGKYPNTTREYYNTFAQRHCAAPGRRHYIAMKYPNLGPGEGSLLPKEHDPLPTPRARQERVSVLDENHRAEMEQSLGENPVPTKNPSDPVRTGVSHEVLKDWSPPDFNATIAYAVSITGCDLSKDSTLLDGAAVLHQSIRLASANSSYGYHMIAFIHPVAEQCAPYVSRLGYEVQVRDTPFNVSAIRNPSLIKAQENSCCGEREYLKLYSYVQHHFPVVVHLDLDTIVLKPMDDIFDLMLKHDFNRSKIDAMWLKPDEFPDRVDFLFTRDYNMVDPPSRQPHQIGVQGGFLVVRPSEVDFKRYIDIILSGGDYDIGQGWGGNLRYGGYYGAGTIQGLASYYYGHFARNRSVELNRCYFNAMVDDPMGPDTEQRGSGVQRCRTLEESCQDCRNVDIDKIYTAHFTICQKPYWCHAAPVPLCKEMHNSWHGIRLSLEQVWMKDYPGYEPSRVDNGKGDITRGHCDLNKDGAYLPLRLPTFDSNATTTFF